MKAKEIYINRDDMERLRALIEVYDGNCTDLLEEELDRARIVYPKDIPGDVITMNSVIRMKDIDTGEEHILTLVFPGNKAETDTVSVLAPAGTAILGYREKDIVEWKVPSGKKRVRILEIMHQPERVGKYDA